MPTARLRFFKRDSQSLVGQGTSAEERGYVLVILAILIGLLLSFAGLAVDTGRLYQAKTRLERAGRAAAVAGVGYRAQRGWFYVYGGPTSTGPQWNTPTAIEWANPTGNRFKEVQLKAFRVLRENLKASGLDVSPSSLLSPSTTCSATIDSVGFDDADWSTVSACTFTGINYDPRTDRIAVNIVYDAPTFLAGRVPVLSIASSCAGGRCRMSFNADAQLQPAAIAFIPDVSGSMRCAAVDSTPQDCDSTAIAPNRKIDKLVNASKAFYRMFNPMQDYIAVIPFNLVAAPAVAGLSADASAPFGNTQARWNAFRKLLTSVASDPDNQGGSDPGLVPRSNTNHCDALIEARNRMAGVNVPSGEKFFVFFTDGAPTAGRYNFINIRQANVNTAFTDQGLAYAGQANDYFMYSVEWRDPGTGAVYTGPSPLIHNTRPTGVGYPDARARLYGYEIGLNNGQIFPQATLASNPQVIPITPKANWTTPSNFSSVTQFRQILDYGLNGNFGFIMPGQVATPPYTPALINSMDIDLTDTDPVPVGGNSPYFQQIFYHCTLEAAQSIRNTDGTIFAVGLGQPLPPAAFRDATSTRGDPNGDHVNQWARKDGYFRWVAKDFEAGGDFSFAATPNRASNKIKINPTYIDPVSGATVNNPHSHRTTVANPNLQFEVGFQRGASMLAGGRTGAYFGTNDATELTDIFVGIAKRILSRVGA